MRLLLILVLTLLFFSNPLYSKSPEEILKNMSLNEKIGQMILVYHSPLKFLKKYKIGGVLIMQNMIKKDLHIKRELSKIQISLKVPLLVTIDQEGGTINRIGNIKRFSKLPSALKMAEFDSDSITQIALKASIFLKSIGVNTNLAPCVDPSFSISGDTTFMLIRERSFGRDPAVITTKSLSFINGMTNNKVFSILKHFPGYDAINNSDEELSISNVSDSALLVYMKPFRNLSENASGIMMNNIIYKNIDTLPAVLSPVIVKKARDLYRDKVIITDDLWAVSLRSFINPGKKIYRTKYPNKKFIKIAELAFLAGNDILMITFPKKVPLIIKGIKRALKKDPTLIESVDESVLRILRLKASL